VSEMADVYYRDDEPLSAADAAKIDAAWENYKKLLNRCNIPPEGWYCTRTPGHSGPCAALPEPQP